MRKILPLLFVTACFNVDPSRVILRCDAEHSCPAGLACLGNQTCGASPDDSGASDLSIDMSLTGCTVPGGTPIGRAWACPVAHLDKGQASGLCAAGFKLCTVATDLQADPKCHQLNGFYAAQYPSSYATPGFIDTTQCAATNFAYPVYFGCGKVNVGIVYNMAFACGGFDRAIDCTATGSGWNCQPTLNDTTTTVPAGVLCCPT